MPFAEKGKRERKKKERKKERKKDLTLERKKVVTAQKHTNFQFVFFLRCDFEEFLFTFRVCAPNGLNRKRERERRRKRKSARAHSLIPRHSLIDCARCGCPVKRVIVLRLRGTHRVDRKLFLALWDNFLSVVGPNAGDKSKRKSAISSSSSKMDARFRRTRTNDCREGDGEDEREDSRT